MAASPASAAAPNGTWMEATSTMPCQTSGYDYLIGRPDTYSCQFRAIDITSVPSASYRRVYRYDYAFAYYPGRGWVQQNVDYSAHYTQCPEWCSTYAGNILGIGPQWTDTWWADVSSTGGTTTFSNQGTATGITTGFTKISLRTDLYFWNGSQWVDNPIFHFYGPDGSSYG